MEARIKTYKNREITLYERIRDIIEFENNGKKMNMDEIAKDIGVSERKINRLNSEKSNIKTEEVLNIYKKYKYFPSYIICGDINSNSKIDQVYMMLDNAEKDTMMNCARKLAAYCDAGRK